MCGIIGLISGSERAVSPDIYEGLIALQHRGQDSAGVTTFDGDRSHSRRSLGLVRDVFGESDILTLTGSMGLGFNRYTTAGQSENVLEIQPLETNTPYRMAMVFNGNIFNAEDLKEELGGAEEKEMHGDAAVLLSLLSSEMERAREKGGNLFGQICDAVHQVYKKAKGAYSVVVMIEGKGIVAFRDPHGIRPLVWGSRNPDSSGDLSVDHIFASENTMFEILGFQIHRDVERGEVVFVETSGTVHERKIEQKTFNPCIFEYVYFARPDALLNNVSVYRSRLRMGQNLARKIKRDHPNMPVDVVIPAPETAVPAALACAHELERRYSTALIQNRFVGRTFILPGNSARSQANKYKLSVIDFEVEGKDVLVVDDSIVRGNVSRHIVELLRKHGARSVHFASASPPLKWPDLYGIDLPSREDLIASNRTIDEVRDLIGADSLIYQDLKDLVEAVTRKKDKIDFTDPHVACFSGIYPTGDIDEVVLSRTAEARGM